VLLLHSGQHKCSDRLHLSLRLQDIRQRAGRQTGLRAGPPIPQLRQPNLKLKHHLQWATMGTRPMSSMALILQFHIINTHNLRLRTSRMLLLLSRILRRRKLAEAVLERNVAIGEGQGRIREEA
jgi:hypothetical protein